MSIRANGKLTTDRNGNPNSALCLNSGFASVPPGVYFDPATGGFTFMAWVKVNSYNNWQRIFDFGNGRNNHNVLLAFPNLYAKLDTYNGASGRGFEFTYNIHEYVWFHIAVSVSAGVSTFYLDGKKSGGKKSGEELVNFVFNF